jgi:uncharacterized membrane protein YfcA
MELHTAVAVASIGMGVGFLGGLFGKGGSAIATPLLAAFGVPAFAAIASPLPATIPSTAIAAARYRRYGLIDDGVLRWSIGVGIPATIAGSLASRFVGGGALVIATDLILLALGARLLAGSTRADEVVPDEPPARSRVVLVAATTGAVAGLLANSGGFLLAPLFMAVLRMPLKRAFGTSLAAATIFAIPGTITHAALGHIDWAIAAVFTVAAVPFSSAGAKVALRTRAEHLERYYGGFLVALSAILLVRSA